MRLLVYNIAYGTGSPKGAAGHILGAANYLRAPERYFSSIRGFVERVKPDLAAIVEADAGSPRTGGISQIAAMTRILGDTPGTAFHSKYAPNSALAHLPYCKHQTNVLLARDGLAENERIDFFPAGAKRLIVSCEYRGVRVFLVHLALTLAVRRRQLDYLAAILPRQQPVIVCGDFNTLSHGSRELTKFLCATRLVSANPAHRATYPARQPVHELDYILYSPEIRLKTLRIRHFPVSDHLPLVADFNL